MDNGLAIHYSINYLLLGKRELDPIPFRLPSRSAAGFVDDREGCKTRPDKDQGGTSGYSHHAETDKQKGAAADEMPEITSSVSSAFAGSEQLTIILPDRSPAWARTSSIRDQCTANSSTSACSNR
jgi:hypothetical protein